MYGAYIQESHKEADPTYAPSGGYNKHLYNKHLLLQRPHHAHALHCEFQASGLLFRPLIQQLSPPLPAPCPHLLFCAITIGGKYDHEHAQE